MKVVINFHSSIILCVKKNCINNEDNLIREESD